MALITSDCGEMNSLIIKWPYHLLVGREGPQPGERVGRPGCTRNIKERQ